LNIKKNPIPSNLSIILDNIQADINLIENYQEPPLHRLFVKWLFVKWFNGHRGYLHMNCCGNNIKIISRSMNLVN
jgi:hypothetical protein